MRIKKMLAALLSSAMALGTMAVPVFADGDTSEMTMDSFIGALTNVNEYNGQNVTVNINNGFDHQGDDGLQVYYLGGDDGGTPIRTTAITIKNVKFSSTTKSQLYSYTQNAVTFENCTFENVGVSMHGSYGYSNAKATFKNCTFKNLDEYAIKWVSDVVIEGCTFDNCERALLVCHGNGATPTEVKVSGSTFKNLTHGRIIKFYNFYPNESTDVAFTNNTVEATCTAAFITVDFDGPSKAADYTYKFSYTGNSGITQENLNDTTTEKTLYIDGNYIVDYPPTAAKVAKIGTTEYETLEDAVKAAQSGDTITMLSDYTADAKVIVDKGITLDLGGHTVTGTIDFKSGVSTIKNGKLTSDGQTVNVNGSATDTPVKLTVASDVTINGAYGLCAFPATRPNPGVGYSVIDVYGKIESGGIFVSGNIVQSGTATKTNGAVINIKNGASVNHSTDQAIAMNGHSYVTVEDGATVTGREAIGVKRGVLTVNGGTLSATGDNKVPVTANYNGTEESGAVISVTSAYNKYPGKIQVNLNGANYTSAKGNAVYMGLSSTDEYINGAEVKISGGDFTAAGDQDAVLVNADGVSATISGGTFSTDPQAHLASGKSSVKDESKYKIISTDTTRNEITDAVVKTGDAVTIKSATVDNFYDQVTATMADLNKTIKFHLSVVGGQYDGQSKYIELTGIKTSGNGSIVCGLIITNIPDNVTVTVD